MRKHDEIGDLAETFRHMQQKIQAVLDESEKLFHAVRRGELAVRSNAAAFTGGWRELVQGQNNVLDAFVTPLNRTTAYLELLSQGETPATLVEEVHGDFNAIKENLNVLIAAVQETTRIAEEIAGGNVTVEVVERSENDRLMQALNRMIQSLRNVAGVAEEMATGNLTVEVQERSDDDVLMQSLNRMLTKLNHIVHEVKTTAEYVANGSVEMSSKAEMLSQGASQQAAAAEEASASMEQMAANIRQNSDNARMTEQMALQSAKDAREGGEAVARTIQAMKEIERRVSVIQDIAGQTNILSINATIEAAKAQEYGKGFAVVASEVRSLAGRSGQAAEEIEELVRSCVEISEQAGSILDRLVPNSDRTAELVQEITAASGEQTTGADQVNHALQQLDLVIQQNAATAENMATTSEEFSAQATQLREAMNFFTVRDLIADMSEEHLHSGNIIDALLPFFQGAEAEKNIAALDKLLHTVKTSEHESKTNDPESLESEHSSKKDRHSESEGHTIDLRKDDCHPDRHDTEFERY